MGIKCEYVESEEDIRIDEVLIFRGILKVDIEVFRL
jgi:hypothetical protein